MAENNAFAGLALDTALEVSEEQLAAFRLYAQMLTERNKVMNLTSITEPAEIYQKHFSDSVLLLDHIGLKKNARCVDVGSGAGFPAIPLCIMRPDLEFVLLDSLNKRVGFLNEVIAELDLNARAIHARAEDGARIAGFRDGFDYAFSRAVAGASPLLEYCLPFVKQGGAFIAYKTAGARAEFSGTEKALSLLKGGAPEFFEFETPWGGRSLVLIPKLAPTPRVYPRKAGMAAKQPL